MAASSPIALEVRHDLIAEDEAVGVAAVVGMAGELNEPVRRDQTEAVPAPPPGLPDPALLEHDVRNGRLRELAAHRESRLTGAHDHHVGSVGHRMTKSRSRLAWVLTCPRWDVVRRPSRA
jgi:hypothetical protein